MIRDILWLRELDTETSSPSTTIPCQKQRCLEPPLQTSGQSATQRPGDDSELLFTGGTDSDRINGNSSPTNAGITVPLQGVQHKGPAWPDIEDEEVGPEWGEVPEKSRDKEANGTKVNTVSERTG